METRVENARVLGERPSPGPDRPFFTIAIPNYKRRPYLELNIASIVAQTSRSFEILVSDDCGGDDSNEVIPKVLEASDRPYRYYAQERNLGYDGNVRFCLRNARGRYVFMIGNDDALAAPTVMAEVEAALRELGFPEIAVTNTMDVSQELVATRAFSTTILGSGPAAALKWFRSFSFTSGLIYDRDATAVHDTAKWDRSIYIQIYLACRLLASGGRLAGINVLAVVGGTKVGGETTRDSYQVRYKDAPWSFARMPIGLESVIRVTLDAVLPSLPAEERSAAVRRIFTQLLTITYPFWLFEYRELANWAVGVGIARDLWPGRQLEEYDVAPADKAALWAVYSAVTFVGLTFPAKLFNRYRGPLGEAVRRARQRVS
jgi:glycosyltransferase involved in cell wall biosynthesis